jgi:hypothetical protein
MTTATVAIRFVFVRTPSHTGETEVYNWYNLILYSWYRFLWVSVRSLLLPSRKKKEPKRELKPGIKKKNSARSRL